MKIEIPEATELELEFLYDFPPSSTHQEIIDHFRIYILENEKWAKKGNQQAAVRARNALFALFKATKARRREIQNERTELRAERRDETV